MLATGDPEVDPAEDVGGDDVKGAEENTTGVRTSKRSSASSMAVALGSLPYRAMNRDRGVCSLDMVERFDGVIELADELR